MNDREEWRERVRDIRAGETKRWWWWLHGREGQQSWCIKNIFCFFSFPFNTWNVRMDRVETAEMHTHWNDVEFFFFFFFCFFFFVKPHCISGSSCSDRNLLRLIFRMPTQIIVATPPASSWHVDMSPSSMSSTQFTCHFHWRKICVLFTLEERCSSCYATHATYAGNNLRSVYFRKQAQFLLFHSRNLRGMTKRYSNQYPSLKPS